jgi:hypothetical protein
MFLHDNQEEFMFGSYYLIDSTQLSLKFFVKIGKEHFKKFD